MAINDPLGDLLTRIRNGQKAGMQSIASPASKLRANVLEVLKREGYIRGYSQAQVSSGINELTIELKYHEGIEKDEQGQALDDTQNNSHAILHGTERSRKRGWRKERSEKKRLNRLQILRRSSPASAESLAHRARHQTVAEARYTP